MAKYRKKPIEVEAVQFTRKNIDEVIKLTNGGIEIKIEKRINWKMTGEIETLEGTMKVNENDYIIKGIRCEFYPCKPDIFEETYEKVGEE